jgi:hypothetical protein
VIFKDLWNTAKLLVCVFRRKHLRLREIGAITRKGGFRPIRVAQCRFCTTMLSIEDAKYGVIK